MPAADRRARASTGPDSVLAVAASIGAGTVAIQSQPRPRIALLLD